MFIYTVKASTLKMIAAVTAALAALVILLTSIPTFEPTASSLKYNEVSSYNYSKIKTNDDRVAFLAQFGWQVEPSAEAEEQITIPGEFDRIFVSYNELQKQQGLDLSKYKRKDAVRYTYTVTNYPNYDGKVYANVIVYRNRVIGGDICSADVNGFVCSFDGKVKVP